MLAEVDRAAKSASIYMDGNAPVTAAIDLPAGSSLTNTADFYVGRDGEGNYLAGVIDFLRVCRGTLADAETTIEELYDWQFDGPHLRDFTGRSVSGKRRDAGALEW